MISLRDQVHVSVLLDSSLRTMLQMLILLKIANKSLLKFAQLTNKSVLQEGVLLKTSKMQNALDSAQVQLELWLKELVFANVTPSLKLRKSAILHAKHQCQSLSSTLEVI